MSHPYRTPDPEALRGLQARQKADVVADTLRAAIALLWLAEDRAGPRMNYEVCAAGMGLITGDRQTAKEPPGWLVDALIELEPRL